MNIRSDLRSSSDSSRPFSIRTAVGDSTTAVDDPSPPTSTAELRRTLGSTDLTVESNMESFHSVSIPGAAGCGVAAVAAAEKRGSRAVWSPYVLRIVSCSF